MVQAAEKTAERDYPQREGQDERRDRFAAAALTGLLSDGPNRRAMSPEELARLAYLIADALIMQREEPPSWA